MTKVVSGKTQIASRKWQVVNPTSGSSRLTFRPLKPIMGLLR